MEECLKPERPRISMEDVLKVLHNPVVSHRNKVELFCIGTGQGTTGTDIGIVAAVKSLMKTQNFGDQTNHHSP